MNWLSILVNRYTLGLLAVVIVLGGTYARGHHNGYDAGFAAEKKVYDKHLKADADADERARTEARTHEYQLGLSITRSAQSYEQGKHDAEINAENTVAGLRAGTLQLREYWQGCKADFARSVSATAAVAGERDAAERSRQESAGRAIAAADACDAHVRTLQEILIAERAGAGGNP